MSYTDVIITTIAGLLQLSVAGYAFRLTRIFGVVRVGWSLFCAFALLAMVHLIESVKLFAAGREPGMEIEVIYAFISFLLLLALAHIETVFKDRQRIEFQARKMEAIGQLTEGVAHDFNNVLTVIQGYANLLIFEPRDRETTETVAQISSAANRAANLARQLLALGRRHDKQTQPLDLNEVINNLVKMLQRVIGEDITLKTVYGNNLPPIAGDVSMIEQAILNLAVNARDAMPKGGALTISTDAVAVNATHAARQREARAGEFVSLRICDTGTGMTPDVLAHISEPFFTTKSVGKGTGLGLSNVYAIAREHAGWVEVSSQVDAGTEFIIYFPQAQVTVGESAQKSKPVPMPAPGGRETILLVEDDEFVRGMTGQILKQNGYQVFEANSGIAALELWKQKSSEIDLVLADMILPGGLSGRELTEQLRKANPDLKIVYTSGYSLERSSLDTRLAENLKFIPKPYTPESLLQMIHSCFIVGSESRTDGGSKKFTK